MAVQDPWLKASQHRLAFSKSLWDDLLANYGDMDDPQYWRQRPQRMAYQYAIIDHLLAAAKHLTQAILKQLANTRFDDISRLTWVEIENLLVQQEFLSPEAQHILLLLQKGDWSAWIQLQGESDFSVITKPQTRSWSAHYKPLRRRSKQPRSLASLKLAQGHAKPSKPPLESPWRSANYARSP